MDQKKISKLREKFEKDGYIKIRNIVNKKSLNKIYILLFNLFNKYSKKKIVKFNFKSLNKELIKLRKTNPSEFGKIYDDAQISSVLFSILHDSKLLNLIEKIVCVDKSDCLSSTGEMLRLDPPNDKRNLYNWHQDRSYYKQNLDGNNGAVLTIPITNITKNNGALRVALGSHNIGFKKPTRYRKSKDSAEQFNLDKKFYNNFKKIHQIMNIGDISLIKLNTVHASSNNLSDQIRITALVRLHRICSGDFRSFRQIPKYIK